MGCNRKRYRKCGKSAVLNNVSIDGGSGDDTLIVHDNNIDFSKVKNFEKISLGGYVQSDSSIADSESTNLRLSAANVKDILRDTGKTVLKIDGDSSDRLGNGQSHIISHTHEQEPQQGLQKKEASFLLACFLFLH